MLLIVYFVFTVSRFLNSRIKCFKVCFVIFRRKKTFRRESIQFSSRHQLFFQFPGIAHAVSTLIIANVWASPRFRDQGRWIQIPLAAIFFTHFLILVNSILIFLIPKSRAFSTEVWVFLMSGLNFP